MSFTLQGRSAIVTGAGRGIGRAIAAQLGRAGARVMVNDLEEGAAAETASLLRDSRVVAAHLAGDITSPEFPQRLADAAIETFGAIDIVVNNAGYTWDNVIQKTTDQQFQSMLEIHLVGVPTWRCVLRLRIV
jgi:3-oxoacyl-[acyl-carrier protein] reductase